METINTQDLLDAIDDRLCEMNIDAYTFDKDLWIGLRKLMVEFGFDWNDCPDGVSASEALDFIREHVNNLKPH